MLNDRRPLPVTAAVKRRLFRPDDDRLANDNAASEVAKEIERRVLMRKRELWNFDFVNGTPVEEGLRDNWQWDIITVGTADNDDDECRPQV